MKKLVGIHLIAIAIGLCITHILLESYGPKIFESMDKYEEMVEKLDEAYQFDKGLKSGVITVLGSSELSFRFLKYFPTKYFPNKLNTRIIVNGNSNQNIFSIRSQLAGFKSDLAMKNAKIVIIISPEWFSEFFISWNHSHHHSRNKMGGVDFGRMHFLNCNFNKNKMILRKINLIRKKNFTQLDNLFEMPIRQLLTSGIIPCDTAKGAEIEPENNSKKNYNFDKDLAMSKSITLKRMKGNKYGMNDFWFNQKIKPRLVNILKNQDQRYNSPVPKLGKNKEFHEFLKLVTLLKDFKIKPLFILLDSNPLLIFDRSPYREIVPAMEAVLKKNKMGFFNLWSWSKDEYEIGTLRDITHPGEYGWMKMNKAIYEHFLEK